MSVRNAKLKRVRAAIEAMLKHNNLVGCVVLYDGEVRIAETFSHLNAPYSCVRLTPVPGVPDNVELRFRSKLSDYKGDKEAQRRHLETTANMVSIMTELLVRNASMMHSASQIVDEHTGAEHTPTGTFDPKQEH